MMGEGYFYSEFVMDLVYGVEGLFQGKQHSQTTGLFQGKHPLAEAALHARVCLALLCKAKKYALIIGLTCKHAAQF